MKNLTEDHWATIICFAIVAVTIICSITIYNVIYVVRDLIIPPTQYQKFVRTCEEIASDLSERDCLDNWGKDGVSE